MKDVYSKYLSFGITCLLIGVIGIVVFSVAQYTGDMNVPDAYGLVWDAGSSASRLYIYSWPVNKQYSTALVSEIDRCQAEGEGLSSYLDDPAGAGRSLEKCMNETAMVTVPEEDHADSILGLGCTAGMRLAEKESKEESDAVMEAVEQTLNSYPFNVQSVSILTGGEEGSFSWNTVNYLLGNFAKGPALLSWILPSASASETVGALDMGGASLQISFIPEDLSVVPAENKEFLRMYGEDYIIYTHSYLCYGSNEALRRHLATLVKEANYTSQVVDPCSPDGFSKKYTAEYLFDAYCSTGQEALKAWGSEVTLPPGFPQNSNFTLVGSSDPVQCEKEVQKLFNTTTFLSVYKPPVTGEFYAFSTFFYTVTFMNLSNDVGLTDYKTGVDDLCGKPWSEVENMPTRRKDQLHTQCFRGMFCYLFLTDPMSYNFTEETWNIQFVGDIGGTTVGWALGLMLNVTNGIPSEDGIQEYPLSTGAYVFSIVLFSILAVVGLIIVVYVGRIKYEA
ncbi:ectonucleoside triphosphate diphosphohydrolase 8-like [Ptychodera flava]|uniref:ectonucleoside triphosphate diphosphohydrolase 8-like n=1 Tax=Ptychodera flava TaxID=63121 RepID=UPI00396A6880